MKARLTKTLIFISILLLGILLTVNLTSVLNKDEKHESGFSFIASEFIITTSKFEETKAFYNDFLDLYESEINSEEGKYTSGNLIFIIRNGIRNNQQQIIIRVEKISALFRRLSNRNVNFLETLHLVDDKYLEFSLNDPAGNILIFKEK